MARVRSKTIKCKDLFAVVTPHRYGVELELSILKTSLNKDNLPKLESIIQAIEERNARCKDLVSTNQNIPRESSQINIPEHTYKFGRFELEVDENSDRIKFSLWKSTPNHPDEAELVSIYSFYKRFENVLRTFGFKVDDFDREFRKMYGNEIKESLQTWRAFDTNFRVHGRLAHHVEFAEASVAYKTDRGVANANNENDMYFHIYGEHFDPKKFHRFRERTIYHKSKINSIIETGRRQ